MKSWKSSGRGDDYQTLFALHGTSCHSFRPPRNPRVLCYWTLYLNLGLISVFRQQCQPLSYLVDMIRPGGWSKGIARVLGVITSLYAFTSRHVAFHRRKEMMNRERRFSQVANMTLVIDSATSLPYAKLFLQLLLPLSCACLHPSYCYAQWGSG